MRPLALEFSAFGPYPGRQRLDFEQLPAGTLFLVHGPTGSGKTTILDAICFALYGDTSGKEREGGDMRCQLAAAEVLSEVLLDFALGDKRFRVHRVPDQMRPRKRGEGLTEQKKEATLWPLDADGSEGKPVAHGWSRVTKALEDLIGLDSAQFRQVVLLPQGQFRKLLTSDSKDRETILQRLFDTRRFRNLEDDLKRRAAEMNKASEKLATEEATIVAQAAMILGCEGEDGASPTSAQLVEAIEALAGELAIAAESARAATAEATAAAKALQEGEATERRLLDLETARERETVLAEKRPADAKLRAERDLAERARAAEPAIERRRRAVKAHEDVGQLLEKAQGAETAALRAAGESEKALDLQTAPEAEQARERAARAVNTLEGLREVVGELGAARRAAEEATKKAAAAEITAKQRSRDLEEIGKRREGVERKLKDAAAAADRRAELAAVLEEAQRIEAEARQVAELRETQKRALALAAEAAAALDRAESGFQGADAARRAVGEAYEAGQAARLAESLSEGAPCPVCGSREHPGPARAGDEVPSAEELEAAEEGLDEARSQRDAAREASTRAQAAAEAATAEVQRQIERASLAEGAELEGLAEQTRLAREGLKKAEGARARQQAATKELAAIDAELEPARLAVETARKEAEASGREAAAAEAAHSTREGAVPQHLRKPGSLDEALADARRLSRELSKRHDEAQLAVAAAAEKRAAAVSARESAERSLQSSMSELREAEEALEAALVRAELSDLAAWERASRDERRREQLEREIEAFERASVASAAELKRCEEAAKGLERPDLKGLRALQEQADERRAERVRAQATLEERLRTAKQALDQLESLGKRRRGLEERFGVLGRVAALATGNNDLNLSLHRFVLGALLDEVLDVASVRLARMSRGRYRLQRAGGPRDGRRAAGLDLEVDDTYTGHARPVSTLSGGESFLAALALALSLAQVVQEHAGGARLDALFVDEGFGSLDLDALDLAIATLETLGAEGGRLVGVISHVTELAQRIPTRLEVTADPRGSSARLIAG